MGARGPIGKRSTERVRRNKESKARTTKATGKVAVPAASKEWHPLAARWYRSLRRSGQAHFFEPSDWAQAHVLADLLTRELTKVRVVELPDGGEVIVPVPPGALMVKTILAGFGELGTSESARRRMRIEVDRGASADELTDEGIAVLDEYREAVGAE